MMSHRSKQELLEAIRPRYRRANKNEKQHILDEFVATTFYHRKYAIRVLNRKVWKKHPKKRGRQKFYQGEVVVVLEQIWEICGQICSKRLHPFLPEMIKVLERTGELQIPAETKALLLQMSRATIDRCLKQAHQKHPRGLSTTKPGSLLKKAIPVRTYTPWDEDRPGFLEIDLVAHCGETTEGQYVNTLTCTDLSTGWTECLPVFPHNKHTVFEAIQIMRTRLPFALLGLDSDNGSEFINHRVKDLLEKLLVEQTKSRPRRSNDNGLVEAKNGAVIRKHMGYWHIAAGHTERVQQFYEEHLNDYLNFHRPCGQAEVLTDAKGKQRRLYRVYATPWEIFRKLPKARTYLRSGQTLRALQNLASLESDTDSARRMQEAKRELFAVVNNVKRLA